MLARSPSRHVRSGWSLFAAAALVAAAAPAVHAIVFVYACLCCRQPGNQIVYKAGWTTNGCAGFAGNPLFVDCDDLFTAFTLPGSGGVGNGYAPAFDRAVTLGTPIVGSDGVTITRIVQGIYPAADVFTPGSYSTRLFAIQEAGIPGAPNRFAPIDISLTGLNPIADSIVISTVPGGVPIEGMFDMVPGPVIAGGDVTIVVDAYQSALNCCPDDHCMITIDLATLDWQDALDLPPACLGDCDRSGAVSFADITTTLANFNHAYPVGVFTPGDANGDRVVNFGDVTTILANFGVTCR